MKLNCVVLSLSALVVVLAACSERDTARSPTGIPGAPVIVQFAADPNGTVAPGDSVTLTWEVEGQPTALTLEPDIGSVSGNHVTVSPTRTTTYTLRASNASGAHTAEITVSVESPAAPPTPPEEPEAPSAPETLNGVPLGRWAFEVTPADGEGEGEPTSGVILVAEAFTYGEYKGVWGDIVECSGASEICVEVAVGGIFRSQATDVLYFALGTIDYAPLFVGEDADGTLSQNGDGQPALQGEGEVKEADTATFDAYLIGE